MSGEPFPEIKSKDSLVAKYVTKPIWEKLSGVVTKVGLARFYCFVPDDFFRTIVSNRLFLCWKFGKVIYY